MLDFHLGSHPIDDTMIDGPIVRKLWILTPQMKQFCGPRVSTFLDKQPRFDLHRVGKTIES